MATHFPRNLSGIEPTSKSNGLHAIRLCFFPIFPGNHGFYPNIYIYIKASFFSPSKTRLLGWESRSLFSKALQRLFRSFVLSPMSCSPRDESKKKRITESQLHPTSSNFRMKPVFFCVSLQAPVKPGWNGRFPGFSAASAERFFDEARDFSSRPELRNLHHLSDTFRTWGASEVMVKFDNSIAVKPTKVMLLN